MAISNAGNAHLVKAVWCARGAIAVPGAPRHARAIVTPFAHRATMIVATRDASAVHAERRAPAAVTVGRATGDGWRAGANDTRLARTHVVAVMSQVLASCFPAHPDRHAGSRVIVRTMTHRPPTPSPPPRGGNFVWCFRKHVTKAQSGDASQRQATRELTSGDEAGDRSHQLVESFGFHVCSSQR